MAKEKSTKIRDLFVKLSNIFPNDIYIVNNLFVVPGPLSNEDLRGYYYCKLSPEMASLTVETFSINQLIYIPSIKDIKNDIKAYTIITDETTMTEIDDKLSVLIEDNDSVPSWTNVKDDSAIYESIERIITNKTTETIFQNLPNVYPVIMGKKLFPLITVSTLNKLYYAYDSYPEVDGLSKIHLTYDHQYFQLVMLYTFLTLKGENND
jgi:hypothetical protein